VTAIKSSPLDARLEVPASAELAVRWPWSAIAAGRGRPCPSSPSPHDLLAIELVALLEAVEEPSGLPERSASLRVRGTLDLRVSAPPHLASLATETRSHRVDGVATRTANHLHLDLDLEGRRGPVLRISIPRRTAATASYLWSPLPRQLGALGGTCDSPEILGAESLGRILAIAQASGVGCEIGSADS
jgi:hypothetical protein